ncbi:MAG: SIR2 family protein [Clostridia bacterium]|nr:SIR2 family protein [Clostridia bacterium]
MDLDSIAKLIQDYLADKPLVVLGSGASVPYGLPSMQQLANALLKNDIIKNDPQFLRFSKEIDENGLEAAIDSAGLLAESINEIRRTTWFEINDKDFKRFDDNPTNPINAIGKLLQKILGPAPNKAVIITTNYDRLAEFAIDSVNATAVTGFEGLLVRKMELPSTTITRARTHARERIVDLWKVHGSLDWFVNEAGDIASFPLSRSIPAGWEPLIIPPGKAKYSNTHTEPYRTMITEADRAFMNASCFLCVGYGFNDEHIQPKLFTQVSSGNKPIVIITKKITPACRNHIINGSCNKYIILEEKDSTRTAIHTNGITETVDGDIWKLDQFLNIW